MIWVRRGQSSFVRLSLGVLTALLASVSLQLLTGASSAEAASTTTTFTFNSSTVQTWTAPGAGRVMISVRGAAGTVQTPVFSGNPTGDAGRGAEIVVTRSVSASESFSVLISGSGFRGAGNCPSSGSAGSGGYYAAVWKGPGVNDAVVAGGGGGSGCNAASSATSRVPGTGGNAGLPAGPNETAVGANGTNGVDAADGSTDDVLGGGGGGDSAGGTGGTGSNGGPAPVLNGSAGLGPTVSIPGGNGSGGGGGAGGAGGGGGGRYGGGGGGGTGFGQGAGGGGGSSYVGPSWTFDSAVSTTNDVAQVEIVFTPAPTITSLSPDSGTVLGGQTVVISGTNLTGVSAVNIGGAAAIVTANSDTSVTVTTPSGSLGARDVTVVTPGGSVTSAGAYTYTPASSDATLADLVLSSGPLNPAFAAGTVSYTSSVAEGVTSLSVTPTVSDPGASVTVDGMSVSSGTASSAISLLPGSNTILVVVTAADSTSVTYTVAVFRAQSLANLPAPPPTQFLAYERSSNFEACIPGWTPSYAAWPNEGLGGYTCERRVYFDVNAGAWVYAPGFF